MENIEILIKERYDQMCVLDNSSYSTEGELDEETLEIEYTIAAGELRYGKDCD
jgi:hypothetical protein